ncbi:hypothetical protein TPL01_15750 [Sulfuriferula plumbiphila]|uniref:DinB-like domain-containing protein n=1 Tax=Sulfuriferula plumbiphila TaxID=171865 RepID=A0A512L7J8_9PROT|nr:hypothetical protein SFPGR_14680 [Sulfuriferula plumbiphila]GEP30437.1 hypothetical protein TPL01_15750 [Sulfuriferula plumbiphila]
MLRALSAVLWQATFTHSHNEIIHLDQMHCSLFARSPRLDGCDPERMRAEIRDYFHTTFDRYEQLFETLACEEAYYKKPIPLRHPLIFYLGHSATFFINKLLLVGLISVRIHPQFESLFSVGVDEMSWDDLSDTHYDWPRVAELRDYRDQVRAGGPGDSRRPADPANRLG